MTGPGRRGWQLVRASTDAVPASVRRFFMAARARSRAGLADRRRRARLLALVAAVVVVALAAGWVLWGTSLAGVREVRVTGTGFLTPAQVREVAAVEEQTPLLRVRPGEVAGRVARLAPVAAVRVRRDWPHTVVIEVVERTPVAAVPDGEEFTLVDADGVGFRTVAQRPADLPLVIVAGVAAGPAPAATAAALTVLAALTPQLHGELTALTVAGPADIRLTLAADRTVVWGDARDSVDKARLATALLDREGEVIDVSALEVVSVR